MGVEILKEDFTPSAAVDTIEQSKAAKSDQTEIEETLESPETLESTHKPNGVASENLAAEAKNENFPKDAVEEWPAPKQIHTFYFVRYQPYEDPKLKAKFEQVDKEIQKRNKERSQIMDALKEKRAERSEIISKLKPLTAEDRQFRSVIDEKRKEMEPLHAALGKLRDANNSERGICSSEEELDGLIKSLEYRIQHESNTLSEEKQLLKEIKNLEGTRDKVIAYAAMKAKLQDSLGPKEAIQDQVKMIGVGLDGVRKEKNAIRSRIKSLEEDLKTVDEEIASLQEDLTSITHKRDKTYETLNDLRKSRDEGNASFYQYRSILNSARDLAAKKDVAALEELCTGEVTKFISQWSSNKNFRDDYEKRILLSLDKRQLSRDGRMRNPDEKPIFAEPAVVERESTEVSKPLPVKKEEKIEVVAPKEEREKEKEKPSAPRAKVVEEEEEELVLPLKPVAVAVAVDSEKLKEMKREEEIAKAKQAQERKKKLAEKAAVKAAARAQKEAEKKLKEREKKAKKKVDATTDQSDTEVKPEEAQDSDEPKEAAPPAKTQELKEKLKNRGRARGPEARPKFIIPRKKKAQPYMKWALLASSILLAIALLVLGYYYYSN